MLDSSSAICGLEGQVRGFHDGFPTFPVYELWKKLHETKQKELILSHYYFELRSLWQELDLYDTFQASTPEDVIKFKKREDKFRVYDFLAGLNVEYDQLRAQVLSRDPFPTLEQAYSLIQLEYSHHSAMLPPSSQDRSALLSGTPVQSKGGSSRPSDCSDKEPIKCDYCGKERHTKEFCWKLHGRPTTTSTKGRGHGKPSAHHTKAIVTDPTIGAAPSPPPDELSKLLHHLVTKLDSIGLASSASSSTLVPSDSATLGISFAGLCASTLSQYWILDSGASDHMTVKANFFSTYSPCSGEDKVRIADGSLSSIFGKGSITCSPTLSLNSILHDLVTGETIGSGKADGGLNLLDAAPSSLRHFNAQIKILRSDNGREYYDGAFQAYFASQGILHQTSCVDTPAQNGVAECKNCHLLEVAHALLFEMNVPSHFWSEAVLIAAYLINQMPTWVLQFRSPIQKGFRCYHPPSHHMYETMDVVFNEDVPYYAVASCQGGDLVSADMPHMPDMPLPSLLMPSVQGECPIPIQRETQPVVVPPIVQTYTRQGTRGMQIETTTTAPDPPAPPILDPSPSPIISDPSLDFPIAVRKGKALQDLKWKAAMMEEMHTLEKKDTWDLVVLPSQKKTVSCKWVFAVKQISDGTVDRYKARLLDVKNAFLHGELEEEVYLDIPFGFATQETHGKVGKLKLALYGLK
ncbi:uncharacterized protein LOC122654487 [Telopea speciosissima]|uniref:uncharacterized protein LOC122654487 n=1 Tax=Telopea speciosissima TaxID=54955 RepID=UPI001CC631CA|nr:uncharacterized protein LOC122654487 [Telopea speciosissima]